MCDSYPKVAKRAVPDICLSPCIYASLVSQLSCEGRQSKEIDRMRKTKCIVFFSILFHASTNCQEKKMTSHSLIAKFADSFCVLSKFFLLIDYHSKANTKYFVVMNVKSLKSLSIVRA